MPGISAAARERVLQLAARAGLDEHLRHGYQLVNRTARREAAREAALAEKRDAAQKAAALAEKREAQRARALAARREEQQASPPRLARVRPAEQGIRTTAYFPPGFVQALRHYNGRYAYDY